MIRTLTMDAFSGLQPHRLESHPGRRLGRRILTAAALCCALASAPAHALFEDSELRKVFLDFREKTNRLEAMSRGQLVLNQELDNQRKELARLRNELEQSLNELATTQRRIKDYFGDVDQRIRKFEPKQVEIDGRLVVVNPEEAVAYEQAFDIYKTGDFNVAAAQFDEFNRRYPNSGYSALSLYYAGMAHFSRKDFKAAIPALTRFVDKHGNSPKAADAMLSLADSHISVKDNKAARRVLEQLVERFPDSPVIDSAKKRLNLLKAA
jgi:tol-pal system protein YbgF